MSDSESVDHSDIDGASEVCTDSAVGGGWADVLGRILSAPAPTKRKKTVILAKARKERRLQSVSTAADTEGTAPDPVGIKDTGSVETTAVSRKQAMQQRHKRVEWEQRGRKAVDVLDKERERTLSRIATRGVVQLFNAVRQQQKEVESRLNKAGGSLLQREKALKSVSKRDLLNRLHDGADSQLVPRVQDGDVEDNGGRGGWSVLREDYMPEVTAKDWDRDSEMSGEDIDEDQMEEDSS